MLNIRVVTWSLASFTTISEAFPYGAYGGLVFTPLYNGFHRMWRAD